MSKVWDDSEEKVFRIWEENIQLGKTLRRRFPPIILTHNMESNCVGWTDSCRECGEPIKVRFGKDYLEEKFVACPKSDEVGHGIWASGINVTLN